MITTSRSSSLEWGAWFDRNQGIACRPVRNSVIRTLEKKNLKILFSLFKFLDKDGDKKIKPKDAHMLFESNDVDGDSYLDNSEMNKATKQMFVTMCSAAA